MQSVTLLSSKEFTELFKDYVIFDIDMFSIDRYNEYEFADEFVICKTKQPECVDFINSEDLHKGNSFTVDNDETDFVEDNKLDEKDYKAINEYLTALILKKNPLSLREPDLDTSITCSVFNGDQILVFKDHFQITRILQLLQQTEGLK